MVLFEDLSMAFIWHGQFRWVIDQSISQITQVEEFDKESMPLDADSHQLDYIKHMQDEVSLIDVPVRIVRRYFENFNFIVDGLMKVITGDNSSDIRDEPDLFGFDKTLVLLTKPGKVVAMSTQTGNIMWSYFDPNAKIQRVFVEQEAGHDGRLDIICVTDSNLVFLNPITGSVHQT